MDGQPVQSAGQTATDIPKPYIRSHTAIRGIAALGVLFYHLQLEKAYRIPLGIVAPIATRGYVWVDLFFILSGFVLTLNYQPALSRPSGETLRIFFVARFARIVPTHLITLSYLAVLVLGFDLLSRSLGRPPHWGPLTWRSMKNLGLQATLLQIWDYQATLSWNIPSWSISAEMHIYLLLPAIAVALRLAPRRACIGLFGISVAIYGYILLSQRSLDILTPLALLRCLAGFVLGVAIYQQRALALRLPTALLSVIQLGAVLTIIAVLLSAHHDVWVIPPFALLVFATCTDRGLVSRALAQGAAQRLGDASYSLYLLNFPVLMTAGIIWPKIMPFVSFLPATAARVTWMVGLTIIIIMLARCSLSVVEQPLRRRLVRRFSRPRTEAM